MSGAAQSTAVGVALVVGLRRRLRDVSVDGQLSERAPFELAALDMAGTTIDEKGLVYRVLAETVTTATDGSIPADLLARWKGTSNARRSPTRSSPAWAGGSGAT